MTSFSDALTTLQRAHDKIFVAYLPVGDPLMGDTLEVAGWYSEARVTVFELGMPHSNPCLDGPVVAASMARSLEATSYEGRLASIDALHQAYPQVLLQVMTYAQELSDRGYERALKEFSEIGVGAVLLPDLASSQREELRSLCHSYDIVLLSFSPFEPTEQTLADLVAHQEGYIFQQACPGKTGVRQGVSDQLADTIARLRQEGVTAPICAGFGISCAEDIQRYCAMGADGVIVGSALLEAARQHTLRTYLKELRAGLDTSK